MLELGNCLSLSVYKALIKFFPMTSRPSLWRMCWVYFIIVTFSLSLPETQGDFLGYSPGEPISASRGKTHECVVAPLCCGPQKFINLMLVHTQPSATCQNYHLVVHTSCGSNGFCSI